MHSTRLILAALCGLVALVDLYIIVHYLGQTLDTTASNDHYSYQGHDFPETLPLPPSSLPDAYLRVEESEEFLVAGFKSDPQWLSLTSTSVGYVRLGDPKRLFMVTMFHELHCLRILNLAFEPAGSKNPPNYADPGHIKHCLDYLRQMALCSADLTLEKGDFADRDFTTDRTGELHVCRDWKAVYEAMDENWYSWVNSTERNATVREIGPSSFARKESLIPN